MHVNQIIDLINGFKNVSVLIIGDLMLDRYAWGEVSRISPEAPVQIVNIDHETFIPGGAANVANNISALGAKATIMGLVGSDEAKDILISELKKKDICTEGIITDTTRPTTTKTRIMAQNQQLIRMDYEKNQVSGHEINKKLLAFLKSTIDAHDIIIISDYSKGVVTKELMDSVKELSNKKGKRIVADPKPKNMGLYSNILIITPNHHEACGYAGVEAKDSDDHLKEIGEKIQTSLKTNVLITRGSKGMTLFEDGENPATIPTKSKEVYDITGAGDTVVAALALAIASGSDLKTASIISNYAAGVVVGKLGTSTLTQKELIEAIKNRSDDLV